MNTEYVHAKYEGRRRVLRWLIDQVGFRLLAKFAGAKDVDNLPSSGPAILMMNHIALIDPIVVLSCLPRNIVPMARHDAFKVPFWGVFPWLWEVIPVRRGEADRPALKKALSVLKAGEVVLVAPEGTRSPQMQQGKVGVAYLAARSGAPVVPAAVEGTIGYPSLRLDRRDEPGATVRLGRPFRFKPTQGRVDRLLLRKMTDEAMYVLAALLPEARRGVYADLSR
ncbi:MAG: lysophospholipid acyltransferase family protein, partial [Chloroflexota bacterium]